MTILPPEKSQITDQVIVQMDRGREVVDEAGLRGLVTVELFGPDGELKYYEQGRNLVTDYGDDMIATRMYDNAIEIVTGMKLGTGATAAAKNGAGAATVAYESGSQEALDGTPTEATKGAGAGWRTTFVCTWAAGDVIEAALAEVMLTNQTAIADDASVEGDTVARYVFGSTIDKQAADSLVVTWNIDVLGA